MRKIQFTSDDITNIVNKYHNGIILDVIADEFNVCRHTISKLLKTKDVIIKHKCIFTKDEIKTIIGDYTIRKFTADKIAKNFSVSQQTIIRLLEQNQIPRRNISIPSPIPETEIYNIVDLYKNKLLGELTIAKIYGVSRKSVTTILRKENILRRSKKVFMGGRSESQKRHRQKNREALNLKARIKAKERRATDPMFKLCNIVRNAISYSLRKKDHKKTLRTFNALPYTPEELMRHLESQFTPEMSWENQGTNGWHIDHKRPISSFNFTCETDPEFQQCWSLDNLQPLWATTRVINGVEYMGNLNKRAKFTPLLVGL